MNDQPHPVIQIAIGTLQPLPNYITANQLRPDVVAMISTNNDADVIRHTVRVCDALADAGMIVRPFPGLPASGYAAMHAFMSDVLGKLREEWPDARLQLNMTGGTKVMAVAALTVFGGQPGSEVVYLDTPAGQIEYLQPPHRAPQRLTLEYALAPVMGLHGFHVEKVDSQDPLWCERVNRRADLTHLIARVVSRGLPRLLNAAGQHFMNTGSPFALKEPASGDLLQILQQAASIGALQWSEEPTIFTFSDQESAGYFAGKWLEEYLWLELSRIPGLQVFCSVYGYWSDSDSASLLKDKGYNELDIVLFKDHRLHVIECKTALMDNNQRVTQVLATLSQLARASGGSLAKSMLVSFHPLREGDKARAREIGVQVCEGDSFRLIAKRTFAPGA